MKKLVYALISVLVSHLAMMSQTDTKNYVKTSTYQVKTQDGSTNATTGQTLTDDDKIEGITYYDALGRPVQSIAKQAGGNRENIVTPIVYDIFGRQVKNYLPYAYTSSSSTALNYVPQSGVLEDLEAHYVAKYPQDQITTSSINAYSEKFLESSPLNRVYEQTAPGNDWRYDGSKVGVVNTQRPIPIDFYFHIGINELTGTSGGGGIQIHVGFNELRVIFSGSWSPAPLNTGQILYLDTGTYNIGNHNLGQLSDLGGNLIPYFAEINNGYFVITSTNPSYVTSGFNTSVNIGLSIPVQYETYQIRESQNNSIRFEYSTNTFYDGVVEADNIKHFKVNFSGDTESPVLTYLGYYADSELYKTITKDENWQPDQNPLITIKDHTVEEFKDKHGRVVLKRTYNNNIAHDTYYVYDDYGNLTYVLSPEGSDTVLDGNGDVVQSVLDKLCYQYRYDYRNRLIEKKIPGKGWEYIVYNKLDQPILTQDANLDAQNLWLFTKYDAFGRVAYTGMMSTSSPRATLQASVDGLAHKNETRTTSSSTIAGTVVYYDNQAYPTVNIQQLLTINYYDDYNWDTGNSFEASYNMTLSSGLLKTGNQIEKTASTGWGNAGFKSQATIAGDGYVQWTVTQTDKAVMVGLSRTDSAPNDSYNTIDYALYTGADTMSRVYIYEEGVGKSIPITNYVMGDVFKVERVGDQILYKKNDVVFYSSMTPSAGTLLADSAFNHIGTIIEDVFVGYSVMGQAFSGNTKGLATGSKVRVLDTNDWITNVSYYDVKGRPIHSSSVNPYLETTDATSSLLDFTGKVLKSHSTHKLLKVPMVTVDKFTYDHSGRLLRQIQEINGGTEQLIAKNTYDELGQLVQKQVGGTLPQWSTYVNYAPNVSTTNNIITKIGGTNVWTDAGVSTQENIQGDGYLSFKVTQVWNSFMAGLSYTDTNNNYTSINYAIYILAGGKVHVYESGANKGEKTSYVPGDVFSVERRGTSIYYLKNGEPFYASTVPTTTASMVGDVSIFHINTVIKDLVLVNLKNTLQDVDYAYNIRGWLKNINDPNSLGSDLFSFEIGYNNPTVSGATSLFNGNISETLWKTDNVDNSLKSYKYTYDALNRISSGIDNLDRYSLGSASPVVYDKNGNITGLHRKGHTNAAATTFGVMDNLDYDYDGNQLKKVTDIGNTNMGFKDGANVTVEYVYDDNGNMVEDYNKGIERIQYNHLNLPIEVTITNQGVIEYVYDATGVKLSKKVMSVSATPINTQYAGNYVYEFAGTNAPQLKFFNHPEGYVDVTTVTTDSGPPFYFPLVSYEYGYVYQYKDHLGNIRLSYNETASISVNESFSGTTYDWVPPGSGSINSNNDKMNINIANKWNAAAKYMDIIPGETLRISFDFDKGTMGSMYLFVLERINGVWEPQANRDVFALQTGHFETELNLTGSHIKIYFEKGTAADDGTLTTSYVDNFSVSQTELEIIEENNYYPFGLKHKGYNDVVSANVNSIASKFKYNGTEFEESLGLNLYEMPFRQYDPAIARWTSIDPITHFSNSTYSAFDNNPVFWADPSGADSETDMYGRQKYDSFTGLFIPSNERGEIDYSNNNNNSSSSNSNYDGQTDPKKKKQKNPNHPNKIDFNKGDNEILNSIVEWAIYIRENNEEKIYLSDIVVDVKKAKKRTLFDGLLDMGGNGTYKSDKTIIDNEGNRLTVGFFRDYLSPNAFSDNSIIEVYFLGKIGQVGNSFRYDIMFYGHSVDNGKLPTLFYMNFIGKNFYDRIKDRIINPQRAITIDGKQQGELSIPPKN